MIAVAKKKKPLQTILDNIDHYTVNELENINGQPTWIKKHLVTHKKLIEKRAAGYLTPEEIAAIMISKSLQ